MNKVAKFVGIPYLKRLISNQSEQPKLASSPTRSTLKPRHLPGTLQHLKTLPPRKHFIALSNLATFQHSNSHLPGTLQHLKTLPPRKHFIALSNLATFQHSHSHLPEVARLAARSKSIAPCSKGLSNFAPWTSQQRTLKHRKEHTLKSLKAMRGGRRPPNAGPPRARKSPRAAKLPRASHSRASHSRASLSLPSLPFPSLAGPPKPSRGSPSSPDLFQPHPILIEPNPSLSNPLQASPSHSKPLQT